MCVADLPCWSHSCFYIPLTGTWIWRGQSTRRLHATAISAGKNFPGRFLKSWSSREAFLWLTQYMLSQEKGQLRGHGVLLFFCFALLVSPCISLIFNTLTSVIKEREETCFSKSYWTKICCHFVFKMQLLSNVSISWGKKVSTKSTNTPHLQLRAWTVS